MQSRPVIEDRGPTAPITIGPADFGRTLEKGAKTRIKVKTVKKHVLFINLLSFQKDSNPDISTFGTEAAVKNCYPAFSNLKKALSRRVQIRHNYIVCSVC